MVKLYVPDSIPSDYKYITNITNTYYDIYALPNTQGSRGIFYRVYYSLDEDLIQENTYNHSLNTGITTIPIERTNDILARKDISNICVTCFSVIFLILFLFNILSSILRKGGVFGGLL